MADDHTTKLHPNTKDISGMRFGRLTVVSVSHSRKHLKFKGTVLYWKCICDCDSGKEVIIPAPSLNSGDAKSCGCYQKDRCIEVFTTHGLRHSNEYSIWNMMKQRCENPTNHAYRDYGGRGIAVCKEWSESFACFYSDMGPRPRGLTLNRLDNDGNYAPGNVNWATRKEQARNKRTTIKVLFQGKSIALGELSELTGIAYKTLWHRNKHGRPLVGLDGKCLG